MEDLKYRQLFQRGEFWKGLMIKLKNDVRSEPLKTCADAFHANVERLAGFALMPAAVAFEVRRDQIFLTNAMIRAKAAREMTLDEASSFEVPKEVVEDMAANMVLLNLNRSDHLRHLYQLGIGTIELMTRDRKPMRDSVRHIFSTVILGSWTAFESLASDLWVAGVDHATREIANRVHAFDFPKSDEPITEKRLLECKFNAREQYGSFLRDLDRVSFRRLESIKRYYKAAFGSECKAIFDKIADGYILALSAVRNTLVHNAGKADRQFLNLVPGGRFAEFKEIKEGELVPLDGEIVRRLSFAALEVGQELIQFVDDALTAA